jgi:hypothetical protein
MVMGLHRHGARHSYVHLEKPEEIGMLTQNGHRMAYLLGKYIRQKFPGFFSDRMNSGDTFVYASALPRCRRTAQAVLQGIYDFGTLPEAFEVDKRFAIPEWDNLNVSIDFPTTLPAGAQPVPIHSFLEVENHVFQPDRSDICPSVRRKLTIESPTEVAPMLKAINELLPKLRNEVFDYRKLVNKDVLTTLKDFSFPDYYHSQRYLGNSLGLSEADYLRFERIDAQVMAYETFRIPEISKYLFTELARVMIGRFEELQRDLGTTKDIRRLVLFSGHDTNVYGALLAAGLAKNDCLRDEGECTINPRYAAVLLFEVYEESDQFFVETTHNDEKILFCPREDGKDCTLAQFIQRLKAITFAEDIEVLRDRYCRLPPDAVQFNLVWLIGFLGAVALICGGLALHLSRKKGEQP